MTTRHSGLSSRENKKDMIKWEIDTKNVPRWFIRDLKTQKLKAPPVTLEERRRDSAVTPSDGKLPTVATRRQDCRWLPHPKLEKQADSGLVMQYQSSLACRYAIYHRV